jgi:hypothetical protein
MPTAPRRPGGTDPVDRALATIQVVFDLVLVAALVATLSGGLRQRVVARWHEPAR